MKFIKKFRVTHFARNTDQKLFYDLIKFIKSREIYETIAISRMGTIPEFLGEELIKRIRENPLIRILLNAVNIGFEEGLYCYLSTNPHIDDSPVANPCRWYRTFNGCEPCSIRYAEFNGVCS